MNSLSKNHIKLDANVGDQLTSVSCGHIVVELVKFLVYQRLQIPYNYQWLKHLITQKKSRSEEFETFQSERHYQQASSALENLDFTIKSLLQEINGPTLPVEVCVVFGATPVASKEVYRVLLPSVCHKLQCQSSRIATDNKIKCNVFKTLVTSEELSKVFFQPLAPTNMYVFVQKRSVPNMQFVVNADSFTIAEEYSLPRSCKVVVLDLRKQNKENINCCSDFEIFDNVIEKTELKVKVQNEDITEFVSTKDMKWFQCSYVVKGYTDCIVNGTSVSNKWLGFKDQESH